MPAKLTPQEKIVLIKRVLEEGESITKVCKETKISRVIFYKWLRQYKKQQEDLERQKEKDLQGLDESRQEQKLSPQKRLEMIDRVSHGESVARVCDLYGVSRTIYYRWYSRYQRAAEGKKLEALWDQEPHIERYYNQASEEYEQAVLSAVAHYPELSSHKLVWTLPQIGSRPILGNHGVQNILRRNHLNTYEQRLAYALDQNKSTPASSFIANLQKIFALVGSQPQTARQFIVRASLILSGVFFGGVVLYGSASFIRLVFGAPSIIFSIGIIFSLISLTIGMFFFLYSLKYYFTIAVVLSFSRSTSEKKREEYGGLSFFKQLFSNQTNTLQYAQGQYAQAQIQQYRGGGGLQPDISDEPLKRNPFVSIQLATYNEKRVLDRLLTAATSMEYENYEVVLVDDSTDETVEILKKWQDHPRIKVIHRATREGYKGGALKHAQAVMDKRSEFVIVFDADFIPYPDTITQFLRYFQFLAGGLDPKNIKGTDIAAVQGYQWHVLNKSENWITRGVRTEYAGSYVVERSGEEIYSGLKQIAGSVYMIRADALKQIGWGTSITEDFELTLKLYEQGYKVVYTPYVQAPAEAVSTIKRLIRQRMRWAEGHSFNIKKMLKTLLFSDKLTFVEKLELLYLTPYYLQAFLFMVGTSCWFIAEIVFGAHLPFWTEVWGWSLILTNMFALPLMNMVGLFLEEAEEKDYAGLFAFIALSYIVAPFQGYAALKGFLEKEEGPWFRTPKTGRITDIFVPGRFYRYIFGFLGNRGRAQNTSEAALAMGVNRDIINQYVALQTANNSFDKFQIPKIRSGFAKIVARGAMAFAMAVVILLPNIVPFVNLNGAKLASRTETLPIHVSSSSMSLSANKDTFKMTENPRFHLNIKDKALADALNDSKAGGFNQVYAADTQVKTRLLWGDNPMQTGTPQVTKTADRRGYDVAIAPTNSFRPGRYTLETTVRAQGKDYKVYKDFSWGVLAINSNKTMYHPKETILFGFGAVDDRGKTICDANLTLTITIPSENRQEIFSTENGLVYPSGKCEVTSVTNTADYLAQMTAGDKEDIYQLHLTAKTANGVHSIDSEVEVKNNIAFEVERLSFPTRIYPPSKYPVVLIVKANQDFSGKIEEKVPASFEISDISGSGKAARKDSEGFIVWNIKLAKGESKKLEYTIQFPKESPQFYLLGPAGLIDKRGELVFAESKQWQIAADVTATLFMEPGSDATSDNSLFGTAVSCGVLESTTVNTGPKSIKFDTSSPAVNCLNNRRNTGNSDAGIRMTAYFNFPSLPSPTVGCLLMGVFNTSTPEVIVGFDSSNHISVMTGTTPTILASGSTTVTTGAWHRIALGAVVASTTSFTINAFLDGNSEATATTGTLATSGGLSLNWGATSTCGANFVYYIDDIYVDNATDSGDPGNIHVTSKLPNADSTRGWGTIVNSGTDTNGTCADNTTEYGCVDDQPLSVLRAWQETGTTQVNETFLIQAASVGQVDISSNVSLVARMSWTVAKWASASGTCANSNTGIFDDGSASSLVGPNISTSDQSFWHITDSTTYPTNSTSTVGMRSCGTGSARDIQMEEAGMLFAYIPTGAIPESMWELLSMSPVLAFGMRLLKKKTKPFQLHIIKQIVVHIIKAKNNQ